MLRHQLDVRPQDPAEALMKMPTEDGITTAGPTFEYVPPAEHAGLQDQRAGIHSDDRLERVWRQRRCRRVLPSTSFRTFLGSAGERSRGWTSETVSSPRRFI